MNCHIYTDPCTFYLWNYIYGWLQGENIRLIRNSTSSNDYLKSVDDFRSWLSNWRYNIDIINSQLSKNSFEDRQAILSGSADNNNSPSHFLLVNNFSARIMINDLFRYVVKEVNDEKLPKTLVVKKGTNLISIMNKVHHKSSL